ncbi:sulfurtransferase TusA family protein [Terrihabitans sp. B22-R8]|uniref:sulfurtransferase TusA family protein n=1 Tax=Terrihabitans sp. B22-R8 TaxID=3425128 RepID=UPI00403CDDAB
MTTELDLRGLKCPLPVLRTRKALRAMISGERLFVSATDPMAQIDIPNLIRETGDRLERQTRDGDILGFYIVKL